MDSCGVAARHPPATRKGEDMRGGGVGMLVAATFALAACGGGSTTTVTVQSPPAAPGSTDHVALVSTAQTPTTQPASPATAAASTAPPVTAVDVASSGTGVEQVTDTSSSDDSAEVEALMAATEAKLCLKQIGSLADKLAEIDSRLDIGLNYTAYSEKVADAKVAYDKIDFAAAIALPSCRRPAILLERALNQYVAAYRVWNKCFEAPDCSNDSVDGRLQKHWSNASGVLANVRPKIEKMRADVDAAK